VPSRKPLKSVAHSVGHSFLSPMNYSPDGYAIELLLAATAKHNIATVHLGLLSGAHEPPIRSRPVLAAFKTYRDAFPGLVQRSGSDMKFVKSATMILGGLAKALQTHWFPASFHYRVTCDVEILTDRSGKYVATLEEMWPGPPPRPRLISKRRAA
jgi:hypothetical protein